MTSPQFDQGIWNFKFDQHQLDAIGVNRNLYIQTTLSITLTYIARFKPIQNGFDIVIVGDTDFYSYSNTETLSKFQATGTTLDKGS